MCCASMFLYFFFFFFKQKTAYEMRISDWSSDVCSSDLEHRIDLLVAATGDAERQQTVGKEISGHAERQAGARRDVQLFDEPEAQMRPLGIGKLGAALHRPQDPARGDHDPARPPPRDTANSHQPVAEPGTQGVGQKG